MEIVAERDQRRGNRRLFCEAYSEANEVMIRAVQRRDSWAVCGTVLNENEVKSSVSFVSQRSANSFRSNECIRDMESTELRLSLWMFI